MVQSGDAMAKGRQARPNTPAGMFIRDLPEGTKLKLTDGAIVEIVANANNGGWIFVRYLEHAEEPELIGTADWVFFVDVQEQVDEPAVG